MPRSSEAVTVTGSTPKYLRASDSNTPVRSGTTDDMPTPSIALTGIPLSAQKLFIVSQFSSTVRWVRLAIRQSATGFSPS